MRWTVALPAASWETVQLTAMVLKWLSRIVRFSTFKAHEKSYVPRSIGPPTFKWAISSRENYEGDSECPCPSAKFHTEAGGNSGVGIERWSRRENGLRRVQCLAFFVMTCPGRRAKGVNCWLKLRYVRISVPGVFFSSENRLSHYLEFHHVFSKRLTFYVCFTELD